MKTALTWAIGGEAGFGIMSSGTILAKLFTRTGYGVIAINEYPSLIRGGHNFVSVTLSTHPIHAPKQKINILIALNKETVELHKDALEEGAAIVFDPNESEWKQEQFPFPVTLIPIPFAEIVKKLGVDSVMRNTIALGATLGILGKDFSLLGDILREQFAKKGEAVVSENINIAKEGYDLIQKTFSDIQQFRLDPGTIQESRLIVNASEAVGLGAVNGGMKFAAIYPMTPINALIQLFADNAKELGIVYKQPEDEIAGINMAVGASLAGARSMVATSGGGFALMVEAVSMTGIIEVPLVIDLGMRPGPATGMPTWTEQGELQMAIHAGHGDFPRIVLAPGDVEECFTMSTQAFNLAEQFQIPVFILTDKYLNETQWQLSRSCIQKVGEISTRVDAQTLPETGRFKRYDLHTDNGVSPRSLPGMKNGTYLANSYEHDETGLTTEEKAMRVMQVEKRAKKTRAITAVAIPPVVIGSEHADVTFVTFGSLKGVVREALPVIEATGTSAKLIHFPWVYPLPADTKKVLEQEKHIIIIEQNSTGQFASLIREHTGIEAAERWLKYDGREWTPEEIVERMRQQDNTKKGME